mmetsp:Transcript_4980/g.15641  ORF Transcript_4980/g.15641 Transcript_4980/m.15641 type:complete len:188 (+) Transcript_4980:110-673(+)
MARADRSAHGLVPKGRFPERPDLRIHRNERVPLVVRRDARVGQADVFHPERTPRGGRSASNGEEVPEDHRTAWRAHDRHRREAGGQGGGALALIVTPRHKLSAECFAQVRELVRAHFPERGIAFPTGCSINHVAAHWTPNAGDKTVLKRDDVVKFDIGIHVNGEGLTMDVDGKHHQQVQSDVNCSAA